MFGVNESMDCVSEPNPPVHRKCKNMESVARSTASISFLTISVSPAKLDAMSGLMFKSKEAAADMFTKFYLSIIFLTFHF
jgi:hypothetical protein